MLYADKRALETNLKVQLLEIREKELIFYTNNCQNIGTQAAMLAGFAFAGMMQPLPDEPESLRVLFLVSTVSAFGLQLVTVVTTTLLSMLSPGLALRGPDGSMHVAVDGMVDEYRLSFYTFLLGLLMIHLAVLCFVWLVFRPWQGAILSFCALGSLFMLYRTIKVLVFKFAMPRGELQTGKFEAGEGDTAGIHAGVVDQGEITTLSTLILQEQRLALAAQLDLQREAQRRGRRRHTEQALTPTARGKQPAGTQPPLSARSSASSLGERSVTRASVGGSSRTASWGGVLGGSVGGGGGGPSYAGVRGVVPLSQATIELARVGSHVASSARSSGDSEIVD